MTINILVASAHPAFGELLRLSLEKGGNYHVKLVRSGTEVLTTVNREKFELSILDADIKDQPFISLVQNLRVQFPSMRMLIIPPEEDTDGKQLLDLGADGYMQKPFYLPDLLQMVNRLIQFPVARPPQMADVHVEDLDISSQIAPAWIQDPNVVSQNLERSLSSTGADAALILKDTEIWAQSGHLEISAVNELVGLLGNSQRRSTHMHTMRYFRLPSLKKDVLFYSINLVDTFSLGLVFNADVALREVRSQIISVANALSSQSFPEPLRAKITDEKPEPVAKKSRAHPASHVPPFPEGLTDMESSPSSAEGKAASRKTAPLRTQDKK
jgi:DNA-binding response OmpR family regulator